MAISKIIYKSSAEDTGTVWMDTTDKTVAADKMVNGITALKNDGTTVTGNLTSRSSSDLTASGATVTVPAGVYSSQASKAVSSGSASTPATTITANPSISVNSSTGVITATASATQSVTPTVSAGYVSSGTAGTITVSGSNTSQLSTQAAQTIHPSTTAQSIASGKFLTGTQSIAAVVLENLTAGNIKKDVVIKVGDADDDDCVASVTGTYEGGGGTSWQQVYSGSQTLSGDWGNGYSYVSIPWTETIALNSVWRVTWDNLQYECTATYVGADPSSIPYGFGNYTYDGGTGGTDCPFFMQAYYGYNEEILYIVGASGSHSILIEKQVSGGGGTTWQALVDEDVTIYSSNPNYFTVQNYTTPFQANETYRVTWGTNGTQYTCETWVDTYGATTDGYAIGNQGIVGGTDTGEPFILYRNSNQFSDTLIGVTNQSAGTIHLKVEKQVSGGSSGLEYETGTYTPAEDIARPEISFANTHTDLPICILFVDDKGTYSDVTYTYYAYIFSNYYTLTNEPIYQSSSSLVYALATSHYRLTNTSALSSASTQITTLPDTSITSFSTSTTTYEGHVLTTGFKPYGGATNRYLRSGRTYKWIAVWKPTT